MRRMTGVGQSRGEKVLLLLVESGTIYCVMQVSPALVQSIPELSLSQAIAISLSIADTVAGTTLDYVGHIWMKITIYASVSF